MKDKIAFVVALIGVVIALAPFKEQLQLIQLNFGFATVSILRLMYLSLGILFLSAYFFALDFIKDGFKFLDGFPVFKYLQLAGNISYFIAVLSPFLYSIIWLVVQLYILSPVPHIDIQKYSPIISIAFSSIALLVSVRAALRKNQLQMNEKEEILDQSAMNASTEARKLVENRMWSLSIIESFRSLELNLNKKVVELGIDSTRMSSHRAAEILWHNEVITEQDFRKIMYIRELRNRAAHSSVEFGEKEARQTIEMVKSLLPKLETIIAKSQTLERTILRALVEENGLFLKHHFFLPKDRTQESQDAKGEGPDHSYLIYIKLTTNPRLIRKIIGQIKRSVQQNERILIIVPHDAPKISVDGTDVNILYYDIATNTFTNREQVYNWIYPQSNS